MQNTEIRKTSEPQDNGAPLGPSSPAKFVFVRSRTTGEVLRDTTVVLRRNFSAVFDPFLVSAGIGGLLTWAAVRSGRNVAIVVAGIVSALLISFASAAAKFQIGELAAGRRPKLAHALAQVTTTFFATLLITALLEWAAISAASMFIIPAFILWQRLMFTQHFIVLERAGVRASLEGSVALGRGQFWRGLGILAFAYAPAVVTVVIALVFVKLGAPHQGPLANVLYSVWAALVFLAQPVLAVATTLLYINLRMPDIESAEKKAHADH